MIKTYTPLRKKVKNPDHRKIRVTVGKISDLDKQYSGGDRDKKEEEPDGFAGLARAVGEYYNLLIDEYMLPENLCMILVMELQKHFLQLIKTGSPEEVNKPKE